MSKVILHNGRCGSTYLYLCMDRYYRAREGDNSLGDFMSIYERDYDLNKCKYVGLNEFLVPEVINSVRLGAKKRDVESCTTLCTQLWCQIVTKKKLDATL